MTKVGTDVAERSHAAAVIVRGPHRGLFRATPSVRTWRDALLRRILATADVTAALAASLVLTVAFNGDLGRLMWSLAFLPAWIVVAKLLGLYDRDQRSLRHLTVDEIPSLLLWAVCSTFSLSLFLLLTPAEAMEMPAAVRLAFAATASALVLRGLARWLWRVLTPPERAAIIGSGSSARAIRRKLELFPDIHVRVVDHRANVDLDEIRDENWALSFDRVIVASNAVDEELIRELVAVGREGHVKLSVVPPVRGMFGTAVQLNHIADLPILEYNTWDVSRSTLLLKRLTDVAVSATLLALAAPLLLVIAGAIKVDSRGPVMFAQRRAGLNGRSFMMFKFRTMVSNAEELLPDIVSFDGLAEPVFKLENDPRVTRVGRVLRSWSLDELPQLVNVLLGHMSLVGPRPEQVELVERYQPEHRFRLSVKPGLTGPMQVNGRGNLTFEERLAIERDYIENLSIGRDFRLIGLTFSAVISGRGAY